MKKIFIFLCFVGISIFGGAAPKLPLDVVQAYADNLSAWCETKDVSRYSDAIKELCSDGFRVNDEIICDWVKQKKMQELKQYDYNDYEKCLDELINKGAKIKIKNIAIDNSVEFEAGNSGRNEQMTFVCGDLYIEGAANYHIKEIFKLRGGKIALIRNYESDLTLNRAFFLCKQGKFRAAYDLFENIMYTSRNYGESSVAEKFATSILLKKGSQLKMNTYIKKYKLARNIFRENFGKEWESDYPMLDDKTYSYYSEYYENTSSFRNRVAVLPHNWKKGIPYTGMNFNRSEAIWIYRYYAYIASRYRQKEKTRFAKITNNLYGYVDENGKEVIPAQYQFAYPFDEVAGLALVQNKDGKWGYIDMQGKPRTAQNYDVASDVFVNGKTNAIRNGYLIHLDTQGNEISSVYGYTDLSHKLDKDEMLAIYSLGADRSDLIDFNGNIIKQNCMKKDGSDAYYSASKLRQAYEDTGGCSLSFARHTIGQQLTESEKVSQQKIVDLGLSVKWAGWNIGANSPEEEGIHCGWGDPTGMDQTGKEYKKWKKEVVDSKTNKWISPSYGGSNPPANICGTTLDIAKQLWGHGWRLPSIKEFKELREKCKWKFVTYKGTEGFLITGPNGNYIFLKAMKYTGYWTGELDSKWNSRACMFRETIESVSRTGGMNGNWSDDCFRPCVRPVYDL